MSIPDVERKKEVFDCFPILTALHELSSVKCNAG